MPGIKSWTEIPARYESVSDTSCPEIRDILNLVGKVDFYTCNNNQKTDTSLPLGMAQRL